MLTTIEKPIVRGSGLDRLLACHGSRPLEARIPMEFPGFVDGNAMTWRGNWCHWSAAWGLVKHYGAIAPDGINPPTLPLGWKPSPWDESAADWFMHQVAILTPPAHVIMVEHRLIHEFERFVLSGQIDSYSFDPDRQEFIISDQKSGPSEVDHAESNWQLACYAALLKLLMPSLKRGKLRIFQRSAPEQMTEVEIDEETLSGLAAYLETEINKALDNRLVFETGYKQCRLCPCIESCPAIDAEITAMKLILSESEFAALKVTPDLKSLAELAARGRAVQGPIKRLLELLKAQLSAQPQPFALSLKDGTMVQVNETKGDRQVTATKVAFELVKARLGEDAAWDTLRMSLTTLEDRMAETGMKRTSKTEPSVKSWIDDRMSHLITRPKQKTLTFS